MKRRQKWWTQTRCERYGGHRLSRGKHKCRCFRCGFEEHLTGGVADDGGPMCPCCLHKDITPARLEKFFPALSEEYKRAYSDGYAGRQTRWL